MDRAVPYLAALLLDAVDLATFGPLGLWTGFALGAATGWFLADSLGFKPQNRWMGAVLGGLYCMMPGTSVLPVATIVTAVRDYGERRDEALAAKSGEPVQPAGSRRPDEEPINAEYREIEDDGKR